MQQTQKTVEMTKDVILEESKQNLEGLTKQDRITRQMIEVADATNSARQTNAEDNKEDISNDSNVGVGTVIWYLCQLSLRLSSSSSSSSSSFSVSEDSILIKPVIKTILDKCYALNNDTLKKCIAPYWTALQLQTRKHEAEKEKKRAQRKRKAMKAKRKVIQTMKKQKNCSNKIIKL
ncbi:hypothetical protein RFI_38441 [Reticulomyxa filosa]|uniref:Uncharacterized protein n=1 Tax=Reticulomyxa filosa TaxID=46433 RepID=X6LCG1_RETFI|nr:hypothetical protein RFI_38441 [Reticulomyxa filosa]|eukprot:ETN99045.1 hypothetical protein RFI_38441 [Reticulomyxa filosa]